IEPASVEEPIGDEAAVIGGSVNPLVFGVGFGIAADLCDDLVDTRTGSRLRTLGLHPAEDRMGMSIAEGRHDEAAVEVVRRAAVRLVLRPCRQQGVHTCGADGSDDTIAYEERVCRLACRAEPDGAVVEMLCRQSAGTPASSHVPGVGQPRANTV